jgi:hypothetical protein
VGDVQRTDVLTGFVYALLKSLPNFQSRETPSPPTHENRPHL